MARVHASSTRLRRRLHWPRRPRGAARPLPPILLPIEQPGRQVHIGEAVAIVALGALAGVAVWAMTVAAIRWSIPL